MPPPTNTDQLTNQIDHCVLRVWENGGPANDIVPTESTTTQRRRTSVALALGDAHPRAELEASRRQFIDYDGLSWPSMLCAWADGNLVRGSECELMGSRRFGHEGKVGSYAS